MIYSLVFSIIFYIKLMELNIKCKVILSTGNNKGAYCNRVNCSYHKFNKSKIIIIDPLTKKALPNPKIRNQPRHYPTVL